MLTEITHIRDPKVRGSPHSTRGALPGVQAGVTWSDGVGAGGVVGSAPAAARGIGHRRLPPSQHLVCSTHSCPAVDPPPIRRASDDGGTSIPAGHLGGCPEKVSPSATSAADDNLNCTFARGATGVTLSGAWGASRAG